MPERRPSLSSFATSGSMAPKETAEEAPVSNPSPAREQVKTTASPIAVASRADRVRSPEVPESITNGRITAESLLKSAEGNKDSDGKDTEKKSFASSQHKSSALTNDPVAPRVPEGGVQPPNSDADEANSRIPSITDYAKSLDRKTGSVGEERIAVSGDSISPNESVGNAVSSQRPSNVRPVDIAKSLNDPIENRKSVDGVTAADANAASTQIEKPRTNSISDFVGRMDNSVAGLMREAKRSDVQEAPPKGSPTAVSAAEKVAPKPQEASPTTPTPREEVSSSTIPTQIRKLSDSFSSFARPSDSGDATK